jgi:ABC-2 type transport system permease protein
MRKILQIVRNDLRLFFTSRGNLISLLVVPIVMTLVVGVFTGGVSNEPVALLVDVLDEDNSPLSAQLLDAIRQANNNLVLCPLDNDAVDRCALGETSQFGLEQARERVQEGVMEAAIVIPPDFEARVQSFEPVQVSLYTQDTTGVQGPAEQALNAALQRVHGAAVAAQTGSALISQNGLLPDEGSLRDFESAVYERASEIWESEPIQVNFEYTGEQEAGGGLDLQTGLGQSVPGMGALFVMFTVFGGMSALIVERSQWTLQRLATAPLSRAQLLGGKILARFILGAIQFMVVFAVGIVGGIQLGEDPLALVLVAFAYTLAITALSFALGTWIRNEAQAAGFSLLLSLVLAPLGGAWWPLEIVPKTMQIVGHVSPVAWAMDAFHTLIFNHGRLSDVILPVAVLLGIAAVAFVWGVARFKYEG